MNHLIEPIIFNRIAKIIARPSNSFEQQTPPSPPDYNDSNNWFDTSPTSRIEMTPGNIAPTPMEDRSFDVFFLHPTIYFGQQWNSPINDPKCVEHAQFVEAGMMSVFNESCRIFAPKYRGATLASYIYDNINGRKAFDLAYSDVQRAFHIFLQHNMKKKMANDVPFF